MRILIVFCVSLLAGTGCASAPVDVAPPPIQTVSSDQDSVLRNTARLFDDGPPLDLRIEGSWRKLVRQRKHRGTVPGRLTVFDAQGGAMPVNASITPRGMSRLETCSNPLLSFEFDPAVVAPAGQRVVHAVTQCKTGTTYQQYLIKEFLIYRAYALLTEHSLGARLANVDFFDSDGEHRPGSGLAFLLEDYGLAARRLAGEKLNVRSVRRDDLDPAAVARIALFQYMIGNTDWSTLKGPSGKNCCHNIVLLRVPGVAGVVPVPYDFDSSGLVNATYAAPAEGLGITSVVQRRYRGFCRSNAHLDAAVALFRARRAAIEALFDTTLLTNATRSKVMRYIADFYRTLDDPAEFERRIAGRCR